MLYHMPVGLKQLRPHVLYCLAFQVVKKVQEIGAITVRGNHDEVALERYQSWKLTGTLDVSHILMLQS